MLRPKPLGNDLRKVAQTSRPVESKTKLKTKLDIPIREPGGGGPKGPENPDFHVQNIG